MTRRERVLRAVAVIPFGLLWTPVVGTATMTVLGLTLGEVPRWIHLGTFVMLSLYVAGPIGAAVAPCAWYSLVGRVSFTRAVTVTSAAAIAAGVASAHVVILVGLREAAALATIPGAAIGCLAGVIILRRRPVRTAAGAGVAA